MEIMRQKVIDRITGEALYDEVYDRRMIVCEDDYKRLLKASLEKLKQIKQFVNTTIGESDDE